MKTILLILITLLTITLNSTAQRIRDLSVQTTLDTTAYVVIDKSGFTTYKKQRIDVLLSGNNASIETLESAYNNLSQPRISYYGFDVLSDDLNDTLLIDKVWTHITNTAGDLFTAYTQNGITDTSDVFTIDSVGIYVIRGVFYAKQKIGQTSKIRLKRNSPSASAINYAMKYYYHDDFTVMPFEFCIAVTTKGTKIQLEIYANESSAIIFKNGQLTIQQVK